jgi:hypothetical protein
MLNQENINFLKTFQISAEKNTAGLAVFFEDLNKVHNK